MLNEISMADNDLAPFLALGILDADLTNLGFQNHMAFDVAINLIMFPSSPKRENLSVKFKTI